MRQQSWLWLMIRAGVVIAILVFAAVEFAHGQDIELLGSASDAWGGEDYFASPRVAKNDLPDAKLTPGDPNPVLTKDVLCGKNFRTGKYRKVSTALKNKVCVEYGLPAHCEKHEAYEIDHLIDIDNGGSNDIKNLWPQTCDRKQTWNCHVKDALEIRLHELLCKGQVDLKAAQDAIRSDWIAAYKTYVGPALQ